MRPSIKVHKGTPFTCSMQVSSNSLKHPPFYYKFYSLATPGPIPINRYRSGTVNSKSFVGKFLLQIKWKFELTYTL